LQVGDPRRDERTHAEAVDGRREERLEDLVAVLARTPGRDRGRSRHPLARAVGTRGDLDRGAFRREPGTRSAAA
jgi:hypothetical protein